MKLIINIISIALVISAFALTSKDALASIRISNYSDFRENNLTGDVGSPTITIDDPDGYIVGWTLPTFDTESPKHVFIYDSNGAIYGVDLKDGDETTTTDGAKIKAKLVKKTVKATIIVNGQDQEIDVNNPQDITVKLNGIEGQAQTFSIPYTKEYSNGEIERSAFTIDYQPDASLSTPTPSPAANNYCTDAGYTACAVGQANGSCTLNGQTCTAYDKYACNFGGQNYCDQNNPSCGEPCQAPTSNYCEQAGYVACNVGQANGSCSLNGQTCTAYDRYACNFNGQNYCDQNNPSCGEPCTGQTSNNYCTDAGYTACAVGQANGSCTLNGQTCTAYDKYACNFGGQNYCDQNNPSCGEPCTSPPATCGQYPDDFTQCGGTCPDGRVIDDRNIIQVHKGVDSSCNVYFVCGDDLGPIPGQCGNP